MKEGSSYIELAYSSIPVFADDGTIDMEELSFLLGVALKDGEIDDDEKRVLNNIFSQVSRADVSARVWERISAILQKYSI